MVMEVDEPAGTSMDTSEPFEPSIDWHFSQVKGNIEGDDTHTEADVISCVEYSHDGEYLATGDKGGRVVIFQRDQSGKYVNGARSREYNVYSTFQSHEPEFDYLKSLEIEEKINQIKWLKKKNAANFVLSTNDKTVKLWKISERERKVADDSWNIRRGQYVLIRIAIKKKIFAMIMFVGSLQIPSIVPMELIVEASPRRVYGNAHTYHINSISVNSDQETFLSADDLRINLWHHEITNESFNIVDIKPTNMEELTEVITAAEFHPSQCNWKFSFLLKKVIGILQVWDLNMESRPIEAYAVHEHLRTKLCALYENDFIFDKFECGWSGDDQHLLTGSYHNLFRTYTRGSTDAKTWEARPQEPHSLLRTRRVCAGAGARAQRVRRTVGDAGDDELAADALDFNRKILHVAWHPKENIIALAATNNLYIFSDK
ncbi:WD domain, G-beta repeat protein [Dictyocaulus viviparus]|uniref:Serine/threonine-protein phosphatase 2A 55 kDa regulatory subunit B n=1 Tax=Dictyocaulus viviparus TaxID=29172 RepID=A0A0D8XUM8_DICVI|nr:WD domain, G-beta repeat protein [Dictyocaulus viviparus]